MKASRNISRKKELTFILMGVLAALAIVCSQSFSYFDYAGDSKANTEIPADEENQQDIPSISQDAVSSFVQLTLNQALHFIADLKYQVKETVTVFLDQKLDYNTYFKTLFRLIISPNAP